jgi:2-phospho-L-lactate guanylyltransferase
MPAPPATAPLTWSLVVPVKVLARAKTRLASLAGPDRPALALAMAADTVAAALDCPQVGRVIVVTDDPQAAEVLAGLGAVIVPDRPGRGLNGALRHGAAHAGSRWPRSGIGGLAADLPALRPAELGDALRAAPGPGPRCTPCGRGPRSGRGSARGRPPATGRPGRPKSPGPAWPASAATSMSRRTCAGRGNWGSGPAPRRSPRG